MTALSVQVRAWLELFTSSVAPVLLALDVLDCVSAAAADSCLAGGPAHLICFTMVFVGQGWRHSGKYRMAYYKESNDGETKWQWRAHGKKSGFFDMDNDAAKDWRIARPS